MFTYRLDQETELGLLDIGDARDIFGLVQANRNSLRRWLSWVDDTRSEADSRAFIEGTKKQFAENNGFQAGIWHKGEMAGVAGFHGIDRRNRMAEIGYWLGDAYQGKGLMTKTCKALIDYAFNKWYLNKVVIRCGADNSKSCAIPERLGFTKEGLLREAEYVNDRFIDHYVYGMLVSDWAKRE